MAVRATTRVVNAPKPMPAWPLERVTMINRHQRALHSAEEMRRRDVAATARSAREAGLREAKDEMAKWALADGDFRRYFVRAAADQIGRAAGRHIEDWLKRDIDPLLAQRQHYVDQALSIASISATIERRPAMDLVDEMITRVEFPPQRFYFAGSVGARAF